MAGKYILLFCAQALFVKCISSQCIGASYNSISEGLARGTPNSLAWDAGSPWVGPCPATWATAPINTTPLVTAEWASGFGAGALAASNGGGLAITSASPIAPTGVSMTSDNAYEGGLAVSGAVPFLGAVTLEGALPTAGTGATNYGCGDGNVAIVSEDVTGNLNGIGAPFGYNSVAGELGLGYAAPMAFESGIAGPSFGYRGCGHGSIY